MNEKVSLGWNQLAAAIVKANMKNATTPSRHRLATVLAVVLLGAAACGASETIDAAAPIVDQEQQTTTIESDPVDTDQEQPAGSDNEATTAFTPLVPRTDLVSLQVTIPDEVVADPDDTNQLLIHFQGAAEPCSGAAVTVTETDREVTVRLETGLDPNAAAMSCLAQVFDYEIVVPLDQPLGERAITIDG